MPVSERNAFRHRSILLSREYKSLFAGAIPRGYLYNWLFRGTDGTMRRCGDFVLADLREFCFLDAATIFTTEPLLMARREGRREVGTRIVNMLNLDEATVHNIMRLDDGL